MSDHPSGSDLFLSQCNLAKAAAGFAWLTCLLWLGTLLIALIRSYNEKQESLQIMKEQMQSRREHEEHQSGYYPEENPEENPGENEPLRFTQAPDMSPVPQVDYYAQQPVSSVRFDPQPTYEPMSMPEPYTQRF